MSQLIIKVEEVQVKYSSMLYNQQISLIDSMHFLSPFNYLTLKNKINNNFSSPKILNYLKQTNKQT